MSKIKSAKAGESAGPKEPPRYRIFISYAHEDLKFAKAFHRNLGTMLGGQHDIGYAPEDIFFDRGTLKAGKQWGETIERALDSVEVLILLVSPAFLQSEYCLLKEVAIAGRKGAVIIPVILTKCSWADQPIIGYPKGLTLEHLGAVPTIEESHEVKAIDSWNNRQRAWLRTVDQIYHRLEAEFPVGQYAKGRTVPFLKLAGNEGAQRNKSKPAAAAPINASRSTRLLEVSNTGKKGRLKKQSDKVALSAAATTIQSKDRNPLEVKSPKCGTVSVPPTDAKEMDAATKLFAESIESVRSSLEQFPELKRALAIAVKSDKGEISDSTIKLVKTLLKEDLLQILKILWNLARSPEQAALKPAIEEMMERLPMFGVNKEWVINVRKKLEQAPGRLGGGRALAPDNVRMPTAELLKAAVYAGPLQWALQGGDLPRGENGYEASMVESAGPDSLQRLNDLENYVIAKTGPAMTGHQRIMRMKAFLAVELENLTPLYILLNQNDPLLNKLEREYWKDAFIIVRDKGEMPVIKDVEKTEKYVSEILQIVKHN